MKRYWTIYKLLVINNIKARMIYRLDFFLDLASLFLNNLLSIILFYILFLNIDKIDIWNYDKMLFFYGFTLFASSILQIFFNNIWKLEDDVKSGDFIKYCYKPLNILFYYISETLEFKGVAQLLLAIIIIVRSIVVLNNGQIFSFSIITMIYLCSAVMVYAGMMLGVSALTFKYVDTMAIMMLLNKIKDFARYPLSVYNNTIKIVFTVVVPIGFIAYYPCSILLSSDNLDNKIVYAIPVIAGLIFFIAGYLLWMEQAKKYTGTGS